MGAFDDLVKTPNLKLNMPGYDNIADIEALNKNFDIIDSVLTPGILSLFVDANAAEGGDGTENKPFKTVQEAIETIKHTVKQANVFVKAGTYNEDVEIYIKPTKIIFIQAYDSTKPPSIKSLTIQNNSIVSISHLNIYGVNSRGCAIEIGYTNVSISNVEITGTNAENTKAIIVHAGSGIINTCIVNGFTHGIYGLYGSSMEVVNSTLNNNTIDIVAEAATIYFNGSSVVTKESWNGGIIVDTAVGHALTKDLYSELIAENTFRNISLASAMSNVISTLFMEVFADTDGINKSLGDAATAIENYYNQRGHIFEKTDSGTITLYTLSETVNTGNNKVWVYADYTSNGGSVELAISRDGGTTYTVVSEGVLTDISSKATGTTMSLRIKITGAVTLKNIAWGCK